jgi:penicillin-insensitive murein endopeptidase
MSTLALTGAALALSVPLARAGQKPSAAPAPHHGEHESIGAPNAGKLVGARKWSDTKFAKRIPEKPAATGYGMPGLVALLQRAAHKVAEKHPKSILFVGDISAKEGGPLSGHHSHQSGRDADVSFYSWNEHKRRPWLVPEFLPFDGKGRATRAEDVVFDDARNWTFVSSLLADSRAEVRTIFVASWLKARILKEAAAAKAPTGVVEHASVVMMQPGNAEPHDDHFHVRIACVSTQRDICHDDSIAKPVSPSALDSDATPEPAE